jgi:hypothetical protein
MKIELSSMHWQENGRERPIDQMLLILYGSERARWQLLFWHVDNRSRQFAVIVRQYNVLQKTLIPEMERKEFNSFATG